MAKLLRARRQRAEVKAAKSRQPQKGQQRHSGVTDRTEQQSLNAAAEDRQREGLTEQAHRPSRQEEPEQADEAGCQRESAGQAKKMSSREILQALQQAHAHGHAVRQSDQAVRWGMWNQQRSTGLSEQAVARSLVEGRAQECQWADRVARWDCH